VLLQPIANINVAGPVAFKVTFSSTKVWTNLIVVLVVFCVRDVLVIDVVEVL
jgi:hypothetical protein